EGFERRIALEGGARVVGQELQGDRLGERRGRRNGHQERSGHEGNASGHDESPLYRRTSAGGATSVLLASHAGPEPRPCCGSLCRPATACGAHTCLGIRGGRTPPQYHERMGLGTGSWLGRLEVRLHAEGVLAGIVVVAATA